MKGKAIIVGVWLAGLLLTACSSEPTIDASSDDALAASLIKVTEKMDPDEAEEFAGAIMLLGMSGIDFSNPEASTANLMKTLHGKTSDEVLALASNQQTMAQADRERRQHEEYRELLARYESAQDALERLQAIRIANASVRQSDGYIGTDTVLEFDITNRLDQAISRVYWENTVRSPGRSVPWIVNDSNYQIRGGLEPGETASWSLNPGGFEWRNLNLPQDAELTIVVTRVDGADGQPIYDSRLLSDYEEEKLARLREQLED